MERVGVCSEDEELPERVYRQFDTQSRDDGAAFGAGIPYDTKTLKYFRLGWRITTPNVTI